MRKKYIFLGMIFVLCFFIFTSCGTKKTYEVTFLDEGNILEIQTVEEGSSALEKEYPKPGYKQIGFDKDINNITSDLEVNVLYEEVSYKITFMADGNVIKEVYCKKDEINLVEIPSVIKKEGYFAKWESLPREISSDIIINLIYIKNVYVVKFFDIDGKLIAAEEVEHGDKAKTPTPPEIDNMLFVDWDGDYNNVTDYLMLHPIYKRYKGSIKYMLAGKEVELLPSSYLCGEEVELPVLSSEGYNFYGWTLNPGSKVHYDKINENMSEDYVFYADTVETSCHIPLVLPEAKLHFTEIRHVAYGSDYPNAYMWQPVMPSGAGSVSTYNWSTSDPLVATVSVWSSLSLTGHGYCILTAQSKTNPTDVINCVLYVDYKGAYVSTVDEANTYVMHKVKFLDKDNNLIVEKLVRHGGSVDYPTPIIYEGYKFNGWDKLNYGITEDTIIKATYVKGVDKYTGKKIGIIGDSITTYRPYIPEDYKAFYPDATADINDVNMTWWMQVINNIGGTLFYDNAYSGTCVTGVENATNQKERLRTSLLQGEAPDVIIICMGANDCSKSSMDNSIFKSDYNKMLDTLYEFNPDVEIILCDIAIVNYTRNKGVELNKVIKEIAEERNLTLVKLSEIDIQNKLVDSVHPVFAGAKDMADKIINTIR